MRRRRRVRAAYGPELARAEGDAGRLVEEALEICRSEASDVHVTWCVPVGLPKTILVEHSRTPHLVVVGARGRGCVLRALPGSVSSQVASSADCPVVVVQQFEATEQAPAGVAVGVDAWPDAQASLALAFDEAAARGTRVEVVHALSPDEGRRVGEPADEMRVEDEMRSRSELLLGEALVGWTAKYPDVPVRCRAVHRGAAAALVRCSAEAELLVVGSRGRGEVTGGMRPSQERTSTAAPLTRSAARSRSARSAVSKA